MTRQETGDRRQETGDTRRSPHLTHLTPLTHVTHVTHVTLLSLIAPIALLLLSGCSTVHRQQVSSRHFDFQKDTFSFTNGLIWVYEYDSKGKWTTHDRIPRPDYWQHCFVLARAAKQFFVNARFDPALPQTDDETYRRLIKRIARSNARRLLPEQSRIIIPGYPDLRHFSLSREKLLKA